MAVVPNLSLALKSDFSVPAGLRRKTIYSGRTPFLMNGFGAEYGDPDNFGAVVSSPMAWSALPSVTGFPLRPIAQISSGGPGGWRAFGGFGQTDLISSLTGGALSTSTFLALAACGGVLYLLLKKK